MIKAIDAVVVPRTPEIMKSMSEAYWTLVGPWERLRAEKRMYQGVTVEDMVAGMDEAGIEKAILNATQTNEFSVSRETVSKIVDKYPDRFVGIMGVNPMRGMQAVRDLEVAVKDYGFKGAHLYPQWFRKPPNDAVYYPTYAKCVELDIPVEIHIGHNAQVGLPSVGRPITLDDVAIFFPELRIIGSHTGYPWVDEMIALAWKRPNTYICIDAYAPKYLQPQLVHFMDSYGKDKVLYGTDFPVIDFVRSMKEFKELNLREESQRKILRENAIRVFNL